jgi:hypothetical protein
VVSTGYEYLHGWSETHIIAENGEGQEHKGEFGPSNWVKDDGEETTKSLRVGGVGKPQGTVCGLLDGVCIAEHGPENDADGGGNDNAEPGQGEDQPCGSLCGIVAIVIRCD